MKYDYDHYDILSTLSKYADYKQDGLDSVGNTVYKIIWKKLYDENECKDYAEGMEEIYDINFSKDLSKMYISKDVPKSVFDKKKTLKESYDPTDDVFNRGLAVTMSLVDFITMVENKGIKLSKHICTYNLRTNNIISYGRSGEGYADSTSVQVFTKNSSIVIKSKYIEEVRSVIFTNNILSADFVTEEGNVLTVWWEL